MIAWFSLDHVSFVVTIEAIVVQSIIVYMGALSIQVSQCPTYIIYIYVYCVISWLLIFCDCNSQAGLQR